MCWRGDLGHRGCRPQHGPQRRESSGCIASETDVCRENQVAAYDNDQGRFDLELLVDPLRLNRVVSQLLVVLVQPASFKNTTREVL
jgi:hypothetical protein